MPDPMESFIVEQNIVHFERLLQEEARPDKRRILLQLLAEAARSHPDPLKRQRLLSKLRI